MSKISDARTDCVCERFSWSRVTAWAANSGKMVRPVPPIGMAARSRGGSLGWQTKQNTQMEWPKIPMPKIKPKIFRFLEYVFLLFLHLGKSTTKNQKKIYVPDLLKIVGKTSKISHEFLKSHSAPPQNQHEESWFQKNLQYRHRRGGNLELKSQEWTKFFSKISNFFGETIEFEHYPICALWELGNTLWLSLRNCGASGESPGLFLGPDNALFW